MSNARMGGRWLGFGAMAGAHGWFEAIYWKRVRDRDVLTTSVRYAVWSSPVGWLREVRPHSSCQRMPPSKSAELHRQRAGDAARSTSTTTEIN
ncbi:hypothetical protein J2W24_003150 [Variovorax boronicumulans]|nr:hypothetical protein [Variovorax boronicumulans]